MFRKTILLLLLLFWTSDLVKSLRLIQLQVPPYKREGAKAIFSCQYDLEGDTLYSVKWYKDGQEFYRYVPSSQPSLSQFLVPGVNIDKIFSSGNTVALVNLTQKSAGNYSCEVNSDAPSFETVTEHKYLDIHFLPKSGPRVEGLKEQYNLNELVVANCFLGPSRPKPLLIWFINAKVAPDSYVSGTWYRESAERPDATESFSQLKFNASEADFINGTIKLKCQATIPPLYYKTKESTHYLSPSEEEEIEHIATSMSVNNSSASIIIPMFFLILM